MLLIIYCMNRILFNSNHKVLEHNHIIGVCPVEVDSENYILKRCFVYVIVFQKKINIFEIKSNYNLELQDCSL